MAYRLGVYKPLTESGAGHSAWATRCTVLEREGADQSTWTTMPGVLKVSALGWSFRATKCVESEIPVQATRCTESERWGAIWSPWSTRCAEREREGADWSFQPIRCIESVIKLLSTSNLPLSDIVYKLVNEHYHEMAPPGPSLWAGWPPLDSSG